MSRTFRQYVRMVLFNKEKATAINKIEEKLKAEKKARAIAREKLRVEIETREAAERKVQAKAQQKLLTQHRRYSALAGRVEAQAKEEIAKVKAQAKKALEKLDSYTAELKQKEEKLNEVEEKLKNETATKVKAQESLNAERQQRRKDETQPKKEIEKARAQAKEALEKLNSCSAELNQKEKQLKEAEQKLKDETAAKVKAQESLNAERQQRRKAETQPKEEIEKARAQAKETLEKLDSCSAELNQKEKQLKEAEQKSKDETAVKAKAQENLNAERQQRRKVETQAKEEIEKARAQAKEALEKLDSCSTELNQKEKQLKEAEQKLAKTKETRYITEDVAGAKEEGLKDKSKEHQNIDAQPANQAVVKFLTKERKSPDSQPTEAKNALARIWQNIFHPKSKKRKVALFSALATLSVIAITFGVSVVKNPAVAKPGRATTQEDEPALITLMASDPDREHLTYNIVKGPSYGSLSGKMPNLTYTPTSNYNGPDSFTFSINDGKADRNQATISITVLAVNDAPMAYHRSEMIKVNKSIAATLTGRDLDGDPLTFIICKEPEHGILTLDSNFKTNGKLIYTPEPHFEGTDNFTFKLNDGEVDSTPATVSINVRPNLLPVAESHSVTTPEDTPVQIGLTGSDPDSDPLSYIMVSETSHGSLNGTAPSLTYTPDKNFNGSDSFSFKVNDNTEDSTPATVSITVSPVNDPPVTKSDAVVTREDTPAQTIDVLANDTDIDNEGRNLYLDRLTVTAVTQGKNGSVTINPDGTLSYNPNANFYGSDEFTYTVRDNKGDTDTAKVNVTVNMLNDAPVITSAAVTTATAGALYTYDVNASDPDSADKLTYSLTTKPADMTINSANGLIQWKPAQVGENNVIVKVADSNSTPTTDTQSFTITVNPAPPKIAKLIPRDGYYQRNRKTLSAEGKTELVRSSDDSRFVTNYGSYTSFDFSNASIPADALIKSVVFYIEHFEEERFSQGKLEWAAGTGWPRKPVVWASIKAPINEEENHEAVDSWDITSLVDTLEKLNSLQLQVKNNDIVGRNNTSIDYIYLVVKWD